MTQGGLDTAATFAQNVPATVRDPITARPRAAPA